MNQATGSTFVYVTYIRTTVERLWSCLTEPELIKGFWLGCHVEADWRAGGEWKLVFPDGRIADWGELVEFDAPKRMVIRWQNSFKPELRAEGPSLCTMELAPEGEAVKLTITHTIDRTESKFIEAVSGGWPKIMSNLKSLLETGRTVLPDKPYPDKPYKEARA